MKLQAINWKLSEERKRRAEEEAQTESKPSARKGAERGKLKKNVDQKVEKDEEQHSAIDDGGMHPSRRSRLAGR